MKFNKTAWERRHPPVVISEAKIQEMAKLAFPNHSLESYELINQGLSNNNLKITFKNLQDPFLLRVYTRDKAVLEVEMALSAKFGAEIPMPEFLFAKHENYEYSFAVQRWVQGKHLYKLYDNPALDFKVLGEELGKTLSIIAKHTLQKGGDFTKNLEILPFDEKSAYHPFIAYMKDCLFDGYAGKWLGPKLTDQLWQFLLENQADFPPLEPACLVQGDFNPDNILIDESTLKIALILDWEYAFSGSYLFDIGTFLRFDLPIEVEDFFIASYEKNRNLKLPESWQRMIKIQDLSNFVSMINTPLECPMMFRDIRQLIQNSIAF